MPLDGVLDVDPFDGRGKETAHLYGQRPLGEEVLLLVGKDGVVVSVDDLKTLLGGEGVGVEELIVAMAMPRELGLGDTCIILCHKGEGREQ